MAKNIKWKQLLPALMLPLALGGLSAWLNRGAMADYAALNKPPLSPPGWLFPVVWTLLFLLMGLASYLVAVSPVSDRRRGRALRLYLVQLGFCFFWGSLFFGLGARFAAFVWLLLLLGLALVCCPPLLHPGAAVMGPCYSRLVADRPHLADLRSRSTVSNTYEIHQSLPHDRTDDPPVAWPSVMDR